MMRHFLLMLVLLTLHAPGAVAQDAAPAKPLNAAAQPTKPMWSETDRRELLAKAKRGDADSQMWLGAAYDQGWFGKSDAREALKWFRKAAAQGQVEAQVCLGEMYQDGRGVKQNYIAAAKWYRMAAEHFPDHGGAGQGRNNLGLLYVDGLGVPKDVVQAYKWFLLAGTERNIAWARSQMTTAQIHQAEQLAAEWKKFHPDD